MRTSAKPFFYGEMMKPAKTIEEQIKILQERGLAIHNINKAISTLQNINYYTLTGYLYPFENNGTYNSEISFEKIVTLYRFDNRIRKILLSLVSEAETMLRTRIAYTIAIRHKEDPLIYTDINYFKNPSEYNRFISDFQKAIRNNSEIPFVKHHITKYRSQFPIWVAVELFTLGNLKYFYKNIPSKDRKEISKSFNVSPKILDSWIDLLRILRNRLAHNMRLYDTTFKHAPKYEKHHQLKSTDNRLFSLFVILKHLLNSSDSWDENIAELQSVIQNYKIDIQLEKIGFPEDWYSLLK